MFSYSNVDHDFSFLLLIALIQPKSKPKTLSDSLKDFVNTM